MNSTVAILNDSTFSPTLFSAERLEDAALKTLEYEGIDFPVEISIRLVEDEEIRTLNAEYRNKDSVTDVLSFPMYDTREELEAEAKLFALADFFALGDVIIAPDFVFRAAQEIGDPFEKHMMRMCIHSILHLLGYDHELGEEEERIMLEKQEDILETLWRK